MSQPRGNSAKLQAARKREPELDPFPPYPDTGSAALVMEEPSGLYTEAAEAPDKAVAALDHRIDQLHERLAPVMTDYDPADNHPAAAMLERTCADGQVVEGLRFVTGQLYRIAQTVNEMHRRLVLPGDATD